MRRPEWIDPGIVDENINMTISELDGSSGQFVRARCVLKVRRNKIRFASRGADFRNRLLAAFSIAAYDYDVDAKRGELIRCRPADTACATCDQCCGWICTHLRFLGSFSSTYPKTRAQKNKPEQFVLTRMLLSSSGP